MKAALASGSAAAKKSEFVVYPEAPHAFNADYRPSYRKEAADDGWKRCLAWFKSNGVAPARCFATMRASAPRPRARCSFVCSNNNQR